MLPFALTAGISATDAAIPKKTGDNKKKVSETIKNETKIFPILLSALAVSVLENMLTGRGVIRAGEGTNGTGQGF